MDIEVLPAGEPKQHKLGWMVFENPVSVIACNPRGVEGVVSGKLFMQYECTCGKRWEVSGWTEANITGDEHIATSIEHEQLRKDIQDYLARREKNEILNKN
jgi:hypothetical protein